MHQFKKHLIAVVFSLFLVVSVNAQEVVSPYSAYGIGLMSNKAYVSNNGMGNSGIAYQSPWFVPVLNPALLGKQTFTSFEAGMNISQNNINDEVTSYRQTSGGLKYATLALPIVPGKYGISVSLRPLVSKNYNILRRRKEGDIIAAENTRFKGEGTISQFSLANGWNITENLAIGAEASYNFGSLIDKTIYDNIINESDTIDINYLISAENNDQFSDFSFVFGARFTQPIGENFLSVGATYDLQANLNTTRNTYIQVLNDAETTIAGVSDSTTYVVSDLDGETVLPQKIGIGLTYWKRNQWAISADFTYQDWRDYRSFENALSNYNELLEFKIGGEFTPNLQSGTKYYERITYRAGINISNGPLVINNNSINSFGITFGSTLPITNASNINLAFEVGQRGTLVDNLVRENYVNFNLSFTFNDRWFLRRQFD